MVSNYELSRRFAAGATKGTGSHMFIEGDTIYSYGHHFPIARRTKHGFVFNTEGYSRTTAKHQGYVRGAIGPRYIEVMGADLANANKQMESNARAMAEYAAKQRRARKEQMRLRYQQRISHLQRQNQLLGGFANPGWE